MTKTIDESQDQKKDGDDWEPFATKSSSNNNDSAFVTSQSEPVFMTSDKEGTNQEEGWADFAAAPSMGEKREGGGFADFQAFDQSSGIHVFSFVFTD